MDEDEMLELLPQVLNQVKSNMRDLQQEWSEIQALTASGLQPQEIIGPEEVIVSKSDLDSLASEAEQMRANLSHITSKNTMTLVGDAAKMRNDLLSVTTERDCLLSEVGHWKTQLDSALSEEQKQKQEQLELRVDIQELINQLSQQSEFCSSLGASCCTLLWKVSRQEDSVQNIISGSRSEEFLNLLSNSIESYLTAYKDDVWPEQETDEATFLLALCGIVTNVAASAVGREYLASHQCGQRVLDVFASFISEAPLGKSCAMKNLMLMSLYNMSINQKGLAYLSTKQGFITKMASHLKEETNIESQIGTLRLLQSLVSEEASNPRLLHELKENLTLDYLYTLTKHTSQDIQELSLELVMDLRQLVGEPEQ